MLKIELGPFPLPPNMFIFPKGQLAALPSTHSVRQYHPEVTLPPIPHPNLISHQALNDRQASKDSCLNAVDLSRNLHVYTQGQKSSLEALPNLLWPTFPYTSSWDSPVT